MIQHICKYCRMDFDGDELSCQHHEDNCYWGRLTKERVGQWYQRPGFESIDFISPIEYDGEKKEWVIKVVKIQTALSDKTSLMVKVGIEKMGVSEFNREIMDFVLVTQIDAKIMMGAYKKIFDEEFVKWETQI